MKRTILFTVFSLIFAVPILQAAIVLEDHFDDGVLDPAWNVTFEQATGWTYEESGTNLTVTDIDSTILNDGPDGVWGYVDLTRTFSPLADFQVEIGFSWESFSTLSMLQQVGVFLYGNQGELVAYGGYFDAWALHRGSIRGRVYGDPVELYFTGHSEMPYAGSGSIGISRDSDLLALSYNGSDKVFTTNDIPVEKLVVRFGYYKYIGPNGVGAFGWESVDFVRVTPEPATLLLFGLGGILIRRRK